MDNIDSDNTSKNSQENLQELQDLVIQQASKLINGNLYTKSLLSSLPVAFISTDKNGMIQVANRSAEEMLQIKPQSLKNTSLIDLFVNSPAIIEKIILSREQEIPVFAENLELILAGGQKKVVNIHVRQFYDEDRRIFGTLIAMEDQTYISFLQESFQQHAQTMSDGEIVANSPKMKQVVKQLKNLSKSDEPVLFSGPSGSGKTFLAAKLHKETNPDSQSSMIILDCCEVDAAKFKETIFGSGLKRQDEKDYIRFKSLTDYGTIHLAEGGTLVLLNIDALGLENLEALNTYITNIKEKSSTLPKCRILATSKIDATELSKRDDFCKDLLAHLLENLVQVPSLQKRRKDILLLAKLFLGSDEGKEAKRFSKGAENGLLTKQYTHNNVKELKDAIELALLVSNENTIRSEHIFTGPMEQVADHELDLTDLAPVKFFIKDKNLNLIKGGTLAVFLGIIVSTLFLSNQVEGSIANDLVWGGWWIFLVISFLFVGRLWCAICPLSTAGRIASRIWSLSISPPGFFKKISPFVIPIGFVSIIWFEQIFHMPIRPKSTGILLIVLIFFAVLFALIFERETWCRYFCPLGNFGGIFSIPATLFVRSNPNVCSTKCTTHNCNKGSEQYAGCPVFHHPLFARNAHICKLCFNCLKSCPHGSAKLYLRPPLIRIWQQLDITDTVGFFALVFFFIAPFMLASERITLFMGANTFTLAIIASLIVAIFCYYTLPTLFFGDDVKKQLSTTRIFFVLLLLSWGPFAAFQFGHLTSLENIFIKSGQQESFSFTILQQGIPLSLIVKLSSIWFGALMAGVALLGIGWKKRKENSRRARIVSYLIFGICLIYPLLNSWIVL